MTLATTRRRAKWLSPWICGLSGWLALAIGPPADAAAPSPRPLSEAERQGVILALDYFDQGIEAWWVSLAPDAPLRTFGAEAGLRELEVRTGPIAGATWRLQTTTAEGAENHAVFAIEYASGMDERLDLELRDDPDWGWRLVSVRSLADPPPAVEDAEAPADPEPEDLATLAPAETADHRLPWFVSLSLSALVLAIAAMAVRRRRTAWLAGAGAVLLLGAAGALWLVPRLTIPEPRPADLETATAGDPSLPELGSLLALRRELASGAPPATVAISESGLAGDVERLWQAQRALDDGDLATARELLPTSSTDDAPALGDLLRARLATLAGDLTEAAIAYERAVESFPSHDGLWLEAAQALLVAGFEDRAMDYLERCAGIGSRDADVYYLLSAVDVYEAREDAAVEHFVTGWDLLAQERKDLFRQPAVSALMDRPEVLRRLDLSSTEEPKVVVPRSPGRALELPVGSRAQVAAAMLRVELAGATLLVPGGAELAPRGVEVVDGGAWERDEEEEALAELSSLITTSRSGLLVRPRLRRRLEVATRALGRLQRWDDLLEVTANLDRSPKDAPSEPLRWRALALERAGSHLALILDEFSGVDLDEYCGGRPLPILEFLDQPDEIRPGDRIVTSGDGGLYPPDILIGQVLTGPDGRLRARIAADYGHLDFVRVIRQQAPESIEGPGGLIGPLLASDPAPASDPAAGAETAQ